MSSNLSYTLTPLEETESGIKYRIDLVPIKVMKVEDLY